MNNKTQDTVTFGEILLDVYQGAMVARKKWVDSDTKDVIYLGRKKNGHLRLRMRNNDGTSTKWLPKHREIFATDWYVLHRTFTE